MTTPTNKLTMDFAQALDAFVAALQAAMNRHSDKGGPHYPRTSISIDPNGRKYVRIVMSSGNSRSVYCFIERATGNILKSATWKAPALNAGRGNIYGAQPLAGCGPHGVQYLRGGVGRLFEPLATPEVQPIVPPSRRDAVSDSAWNAAVQAAAVTVQVQAPEREEPETAQEHWLRSMGIE